MGHYSISPKNEELPSDYILGGCRVLTARLFFGIKRRNRPFGRICHLEAVLSYKSGLVVYYDNLNAFYCQLILGNIRSRRRESNPQAQDDSSELTTLSPT
jgi:hypothetical protein